MIKYYFPAVAVALIFNYVSLDAQVAHTDDTGLIVGTQSGKVKGSQENGVFVFKNIPYAAPPVGKHYFAAPAPHLPWQGIRDATGQGPTAPFPKPPAGDIDDTPTLGKGWIKGEDFLTANVWTASTGDKKLPVMVYIYGGAFVIGASDVPLFNGTSFADRVQDRRGYPRGHHGRVPGQAASRVQR